MPETQNTRACARVSWFRLSAGSADSHGYGDVIEIVTVPW